MQSLYIVIIYKKVSGEEGKVVDAEKVKEKKENNRQKKMPSTKESLKYLRVGL